MNFIAAKLRATSYEGEMSESDSELMVSSVCLMTVTSGDSTLPQGVTIVGVPKLKYNVGKSMFLLLLFL